MTEEQVVEKIGELIKKYYTDDQFSCAEAMVKAFAEVFVPHRYDPGTVTRMATPFNGGFSELNSTCGVLTAGLLVIGMIAGRDKPADEDTKEEAYTLTQIFHQRYMAAMGTDNCRVLLERWSDQGPEKSHCKDHTRQMSMLLAQTILQVGFHELELDEDDDQSTSDS